MKRIKKKIRNNATFLRDYHNRIEEQSSKVEAVLLQQAVNYQQLVDQISNQSDEIESLQQLLNEKDAIIQSNAATLQSQSQLIAQLQLDLKNTSDNNKNDNNNNNNNTNDVDNNKLIADLLARVVALESNNTAATSTTSTSTSCNNSDKIEATKEILPAIVSNTNETIVDQQDDNKDTIDNANEDDEDDATDTADTTDNSTSTNSTDDADTTSKDHSIVLSKKDKISTKVTAITTTHIDGKAELTTSTDDATKNISKA